MSSEGTYANANRCIVTVLPSTSPNRRILVFILVAVALVVLIALTATLIPIYMTGDGEDKDKGQLSELERETGNNSLINSSTRSIVLGSSTTRRHSFDSVSKFAVSTSKPQQGPSSQTISLSEMMISSQITRTTKNTLDSVSSSSNFARPSTTRSNLYSVLDNSTISTAGFSLLSSRSLSSASSQGVIDISTSKHQDGTSSQGTNASPNEMTSSNSGLSSSNFVGLSAMQSKVDSNLDSTILTPTATTSSRTTSRLSGESTSETKPSPGATTRNFMQGQTSTLPRMPSLTSATVISSMSESPTMTQSVRGVMSTSSAAGQAITVTRTATSKPSTKVASSYFQKGQTPSLPQTAPSITAAATGSMSKSTGIISTTPSGIHFSST